MENVNFIVFSASVEASIFITLVIEAVTFFHCEENSVAFLEKDLHHTLGNTRGAKTIIKGIVKNAFCGTQRIND